MKAHTECMSTHKLAFAPDSNGLTARTTCTCGLDTGSTPIERANAAAEDHADAVGLPDPLRELRHLMAPLV